MDELSGNYHRRALQPTLGEFSCTRRECNITALADVRAAPYGQRLPKYSRETLVPHLSEAGIT